jgi:carboxymethylenebutenolidase
MNDLDGRAFLSMSETLNFDTAGGAASAYVTKPADNTKQCVIVIQEYWGLNPHIKTIADRFADEGFIAVAPDLYRGKLATDPQTAAEYMSELKVEDGLDTIRNAMDAAREEYGVTHFGVIGFCMGGTYALRAACELEGFSAAAAFYGDIPEEDVLKKLRTPTIFVSATEDKWINAEKVGKLVDAAERYELPVTSIKYEADHAFFNDTRPEVYKRDAAEDAWANVIALFSEKL